MNLVVWNEHPWVFGVADYESRVGFEELKIWRIQYGEEKSENIWIFIRSI